MKKNIVLVFPGQGSQYVGMGAKLKDHSWFDRASEVINFDLKNLCFNGPEEVLKQTKYTQCALITHSYSMLQEVETFLAEKKLEINLVLGHSVGEYAALLASGVISFNDAIMAVHKRGIYMQESTPFGVGKMVAILKAPAELIAQACKEVSAPDHCAHPANFNDPTQTVISGHKEACDEAIKWLEKNCSERFRAIELAVSAPFHSPLMESAAEKLASTLAKISLKNPQIDYVANIDAQIYSTETSGEKIKDNLIKQVAGSVLWTQSVEKIPTGSIVVEVGPKNVLCGLIKKIKPDLSVLSLDKEGAFTELDSLLNT